MPEKEIPQGHLAANPQNQNINRDFSRLEGRTLPKGHLAFADVKVDKSDVVKEVKPVVINDPIPDEGFSAMELLGFPGAYY